jgi:hypothetical protein
LTQLKGAVQWGLIPLLYAAAMVEGRAQTEDNRQIVKQMARIVGDFLQMALQGSKAVPILIWV